MAKARMNVYMDQALYDRIHAKANELGIQPGMLALLAIRAGIDAVSMATDPQWQKLFEGMAKDDKAANRK